MEKKDTIKKPAARRRGKRSSTKVKSANPKPEAGSSRPKVFRCISLDGGSGALLTVLVMEQIEAKLPGFLAKTDMFAGTSAGSITGLTMAARDNPAEVLEELKSFWTDTSTTFTNTPAGLLGALFGLNAILTNEKLKEALAEPQMLGNRLLKDLSKRAVATGFNMDPPETGEASPAVGNPVFEPAFFSNLASDQLGYDTPAVDIVLRSAAGPIIFPSHQGYVDGGVYANNPAMVSVAAVIAATKNPGLTPGSLHHKVRLHRREQDQTEDSQTQTRLLRILSLGGGRDEVVVPVDSNSWGYLQWMFNLFNPLLIVNVLMSGANESVSFTAENILPAGSFFRLDPGFVNRSLIPFMQSSPADLQAAADSEETKTLVEETCEWLVSSGWMDD